MEIDITDFFNGADPFEFAHSKMEGGAQAGHNTWRAAQTAAPTYNLLKSPEELEAFKRYLISAGYSDPEPADDDLQALFIQWISGDIRESDLEVDSSPEEWDWYEKRASNGEVPGNLFRTDDGRIYYMVDA
jgi:hypothetical protein